MGNLTTLMKKQTNFNNYVFPKLKHTPISTDLEIQGQQLQKEKIKSLKSSIPQQYTQKNTFPLYSFANKARAAINYYGVYKLPEALTVLTYNIWFEQKNREIRNECILKMLADSNADFICLQQVTQDFIQLLHNLPKNGWIKDYYTGVIPMGWYDTVILTKYKCRFYKIPFKYTGMGRSMLLAQIIQQKGNNLIIGSMHYESLTGNEKIREQQLTLVQEVAKDCSRVIIVGDYNFTDSGQQNKVIDKSFTDIWLKIHKDAQNGFTMPQTRRFATWRPDHILAKVPKQVDLTQAQIHKIGQFTIPPYEKDEFHKIGIDDIVRTPSDHFGLLARIPLV